MGAPAPQAIHLSRWPGVGATSRATFEQFADFGTACFQYRNPAIARDLPVNFLCLISRSFHAIDMYIIIAYWRGAVGHEGNRVDQPTLESPKSAIESSRKFRREPKSRARDADFGLESVGWSTRFPECPPPPANRATDFFGGRGRRTPLPLPPVVRERFPQPCSLGRAARHGASP